MDSELRRFLTAIVALLAALVVATVGLLVVALDSFLAVVVVGVVTTFVAGGIVEYATLSRQDGDSDDPDAPSRP